MESLESSCLAIEHDRFFNPEGFEGNAYSNQAPPDTFTGIGFGLFPKTNTTEDLLQSSELDTQNPKVAPAMLALDVATVANILAKVAISHQPLDALDIITIGLVGVANVGVIAKGFKAINNPALRDISEQLGKRIGLIGEDTAAVNKIQREVGKIKISDKISDISNIVNYPPLKWRASNST